MHWQVGARDGCVGTRRWRKKQLQWGSYFLRGRSRPANRSAASQILDGLGVKFVLHYFCSALVHAMNMPRLLRLERMCHIVCIELSDSRALGRAATTSKPFQGDQEGHSAITTPSYIAVQLANIGRFGV